jgi:hypothetical protein
VPVEYEVSTDEDGSIHYTVVKNEAIEETKEA